MDFDSRLLRSFAVIVQEGTLTRAAQRLFISQPSLTMQIKVLEHRLGVELFARSNAGMAMTPAGTALAARVGTLLEQWDAVVHETRGAGARASRVLRVGFMASAANEATQPILASFARRRPDWQVDMRQTAWDDPSMGLADGQVDVALLRVPFPGQDRFRIEVLLTEDRWVILPASHRLAVLDRVPFRELLDEPFITTPPESGREWIDYWVGVAERAGHPVRIGGVAWNADENLNAIAGGKGVSLCPEAISRFYSRPGVVYRPVDGVGPSRVAVAWLATGPDPLVDDFVAACLEHRSP